jgi:hypothetical protein
MLAREEELRLAPATQRAYEVAEGGGIRGGGGAVGGIGGIEEDWMEVTVALQRRVVREFIAGALPGGGGSGGEEGEGGVGAAALSRHGGAREELLLRALRSATDWYPALRSIPLYVRHNRARAGELQVGDPAPDAAVTTLDGTSTSIIAHLVNNRGGLNGGGGGGGVSAMAAAATTTTTEVATLIIAGSIS